MDFSYSLSSSLKGLIVPFLVLLFCLVVGGRGAVAPTLPEQAEEILGPGVSGEAVKEDGSQTVSNSPIQNVIDLQCVDSASLSLSEKDRLSHPEPGSNGTHPSAFLSLTDADVCVAVSPKCLHDALKLMMEEMGKEEGEGALTKTHRFTEKDMACALLNLFHMGDKFTKIVDHFEHSLNHTQNNVLSLSAQMEEDKKGFLPKEKLDLIQSSERRREQREEKMLEKIQKNEERLNEIVEKHSIMEERQFFEIQELKALLAEEKEKGEELERKLREVKGRVEFAEEKVDKTEEMVKELGKLKDALAVLEGRGSKVEVEVVQKIQEIEGKLGKGHDTLQTLQGEVEGLKGWVRGELDKGTKSVKETLLSPLFRAVDDLEGRLENMVKSLTGNVTEVRLLVSNDGLRAAAAEGQLRKMVMEGKGQLSLLERDLKAQIHTESLRAKGAEAQISQIIQKERERREQGSEGIKRDIQGVKGSVANLEKKGEALEAKLKQEVERATEAEQGLLSNLNEELKRASEKEEELSLKAVDNGGKLNNLTESFGSFTGKLETLTSSLSHQESLSSLLNTRIEKEESRAKEREVEIFRELGKDLNSLRSEVKHEKDALFERLNALMYDRLEEKGTELRDEGHRNHTASHERINALTEFVSSSENNYQAVLTSLMEGMDRRFDAAERNYTQKLEKMEQDLRSLLNKALTEKPSGGGVFNRIVGFFGRRPGAGGNSTRTRTKSLKKLVVRKEEDEGEERGGLDERLRVDPVFSSEGEETEGRAGVAMVHSRGSKVRQVYG